MSILESDEEEQVWCVTWQRSVTSYLPKRDRHRSGDRHLTNKLFTMNPPRQSTLAIKQEQERTLATAQEFTSRLAVADLHLLKHVNEFKTSKLDADDAFDSEEIEARDPVLVAADVADQIVPLSIVSHSDHTDS